MTSDVVLTSALRTNLLSLQRTQSLIDETQLRLATGLSVNSALDNPSNFFAAEGLRNRASDLSRLLDGIGSSIQAINTADDGIQSLTTLVEQAESLATQAQDANSAAASSAGVVGNVDLTGFTVDAANDTDTLTFSIVDENGNTVALNDANGDGVGAIALNTDETIESIVNQINTFRTSVGNNEVFDASLTSDGRLDISTVSGFSFNLSIDGGASIADSQALAGVLGFGGEAVDENTAAAGTGTSVGFSVRSAATLTTQALVTNTNGDLATRSTALNGLLRDIDGNGAVAGTEQVFAVTNLDADGSDDTLTINIGINGGSARAIEVTDTTTIQEFIDTINSDSVLQTQIQASFNETTGQLAISPLGGNIESIDISATLTDVDDGVSTADDADATLVFDFGFGVDRAQANGDALTQAATDGETVVSQSDVESIRLGGGGGDLAQFQGDFNRTLEQIDQLVADTSFRGVNLLNGGTLETTFNEDGTSSLTTQGQDLTSTGLGISQASFINNSQIQSSIDQVNSALDTVRNFSASLAGDLVVIQTREEFTENLINNLQTGADNLTLADENEEGANLLALQTRQTLGVTSLSLASQAQQSVLRLF